MSLTPQFLDELRTRTTLSTLIGRNLKLQKAGREWKAPCPFHNEKTPSFYVNDEKAFYHCFGCGVHGDAIRWLTDQRGLPFMDAVKELADAAGLEVPAPDPRAQAKAERATSLHEVMEAAQTWYVDQLAGTEGAEALAYLQQRGITDATKRKFGFGFAPNARGKLRAALHEFGDEKLIEAGLLIQPGDESREPYDRFRGRLMFPIRDRRGRVIAFSGRIVGAGEPKYLNSPDTPLFDKGRTLFNIDKAAPASRQTNRIIVVEGQMDVIALDQAGFPDCVAPLGTAVTETQLEQLWRLSNRPLFCLDGDKPGQKAALRAAHRALPLLTPGHSLGFIRLPEGKDPDDVIRSGGGAAAFQARLAKPDDLAKRIWDGVRDESDASTPETRAGIKQRLMELASSIQDSFVREQYQSTFRDWFWEQFGWRKKVVSEVSEEITASRQGREGWEKLVMRAVLLGLSRYPDVLLDNFETASLLDIRDPHMKQWFGIISGEVLDRPDLDGDLMETILESSQIEPIEKRDLARDLAFSFFRKTDPERGRRELREVIGTLVTEQEIDRSLAAASERFRDNLQTPQWEEQQRLLDARNAMRAELNRVIEAAASSREDDAAGDSLVRSA
ncbi:MAG TPA: DNA primase [Allosphingosinicella sp.]|jgi:DNA primase